MAGGGAVGAGDRQQGRLLGAGVVMVEYLANLEALHADEVFLIAMPLRVAGADGAPARVAALVPR